jgi:hypothetical protein
VEPFNPIEPFEKNHGIFIGIGVAAAVVFFVICVILVTIQNRTYTIGLQKKLILTI